MIWTWIRKCFHPRTRPGLVSLPQVLASAVLKIFLPWCLHIKIGGVLTQKKPVATPKSVNWHWFFLVFLVFFGFFKFPNWHWFFFGFFLVFFGFFWFFLALVLARIRNWKLVFFGFFWFFLAFFGFFWHRPWPTFEIGNWFLGSVGFFWFFLVFFGIFWFFLVFKFRVRISSQKNQKKPKKTKKNQKKPKKKPKKPKKNQKKPVATPKLVNWLGFFCFFLVFFWGEHPPKIPFSSLS